MFSIRRTSPVVRTSVRSYAAAANAGQPPLQLFGIDGTYASALYTASAKAGSLDAVASALTKLQGTLKNDSKVAGLISNPTLNNTDKNVVVDVLSKSIGGEKSVSNLLTVMAENNRLGLLSQVSEAFQTLIAAEKGEVEVTITSAQVSAPLSSSQLVDDLLRSLLLTTRSHSTIRCSSSSRALSQSPDLRELARSSRSRTRSTARSWVD